MLEKIIAKRFVSALEHIQFGSLFLSMPDGSNHFFEGPNPGPHADLGINSLAAVQMLSAKGDVGFSEAFRLGYWETSDLEELFLFALRNESSLDKYIGGTVVSRLFSQLGYLFNLNSVRGSRRNIQQHYDLGNDFYSLWLDPSMTYSSALYANSHEPLELAQNNKYDRLLDRIEDQSGSILEIGCGWGGFAQRAVERRGRPLKGLTLSKEQLRYAEKRLDGEADFVLQDYRHERNVYDNIVSIEMFEAVGTKFWKQYFQQVNRLLRRGGKALIQSIVIEDNRFESYRRGSDTIRSYIFPGGMLPSDERFTQVAEAGGMSVTDRFAFGKDYAKTLREWLRSFEKALPEVRSLGYDDSFIRLWRYYLASCAASFETGRINVMQYELVHA
jgi:cyclopropane-fatty-acyl-phospholipid synthase